MNEPGTVEQTFEPPVGVPTAELVFCIIGAMGLTVALVAVIFEHTADIYVSRGVYALLAAVGIIGINGWTIAWTAGRIASRLTAQRLAEEARHRAETEELRAGQAEVSQALAELTSVVLGVIDALEQPMDLTSSTQVRTLSGRAYVSGAAVGGQGDSVPLRPGSRIGLDPETIAAARRLARQLLDAPTDPGPHAPGG